MTRAPAGAAKSTSTATELEGHPLSPDPYDPVPTFWDRHAEWVAPVVVFGLSVFLQVAAFPPLHAPEAAYACLVPGVFWAYLRPRLKVYAWTLFAAQAVAWTINLRWLHPVTWPGLLMLGPIVGAWTGVWYLAVWWAIPRMAGRPTPVRLVAMMGLGGAWVLVEWSRTWLFGGFPWMPLAATQWEMTSMLQVAAYTGALGISFVIVAANVGIAAFGNRLFREGEVGLRRRSPELLLALFLVLVCLAVHVQETANRGRYLVPFARVAFVQPDIPALVKWDSAKEPEIMKALWSTTLSARDLHPDLVLWPESTTPFPLNADPSMKRFVELLCAQLKAPMLIGADAIERPDPTHLDAFNAAFVIDPQLGVQTAYYAKRRLVQFGEYIPLRPIFGWIGKFAPLGDDFTPGEGPVAADRHAAEGRGRVGCPDLLRGSVPRARGRGGALRRGCSRGRDERHMVRRGRSGLPARGSFRAARRRDPPAGASLRKRGMERVDRRVRRAAQGGQGSRGQRLFSRRPGGGCDPRQPLGGPQQLLRRARGLVCGRVRVPRPRDGGAPRRHGPGARRFHGGEGVSRPTIALVGDYSERHAAHRAIPVALEKARGRLGADVGWEWVATRRIEDAPRDLAGFSAVWLVPASPYENMAGALGAVRLAREGRLPFLGTCGGFQHALIEFSRNVAGIADADTAETRPDGPSLVVTPLACSLVEKSGAIVLEPGSLLAAAYGGTQTNEEYRCSYGFNAAHRGALEAKGLRFTAWDETGDPRGAELPCHPFFAGVLFQPERAALRGELSPLVVAFVGAVASAGR